MKVPQDPPPDNPLGLPEFRPPPEWVKKLIPHRRLLLVLYLFFLVSYGLFVWAFLTNNFPILNNILKPIEGVILASIFAFAWPPLLLAIGVVVLAQILFFAAAPQLRWPRPTGKRAMRLALLSAAGLVGLLTAGVVGALLSLFGIWEPNFPAMVTPIYEPLRPMGDWAGLPIIFIFVLPFWMFWAVVFTMFWLGSWVAKFQRMYRLLIAGTILELFVSLPAEIVVEQRSKCFCGEGSFFALVIGMTFLIIGFGPGIFMLYMYRRMQLKADSGRFCQTCGYNLFGLASRRCPECGTEF